VSGCASQTDLPSSEDSHKLLRSPQRERGARASSAAVKHSVRRRLPCINGPPYTSDCTVLKLGEQLPSGPLVAALLLVALRSTISPPSASNEGPGTGEHHWPIRERRMSRWCTHSKPGLTGGSLRGRWLPHAVAFTPTARYPLCEGDRVRSWSSLLHATTDQPLSSPLHTKDPRNILCDPYRNKSHEDDAEAGIARFLTAKKARNITWVC
jgi:hypothetical protein